MDTISKGEMRKPDVEEWQKKPNDEFTGIDYADGVLNGRPWGGPPPRRGPPPRGRPPHRRPGSTPSA
jgi:hypothetical protein